MQRRSLRSAPAPSIDREYLLDTASRLDHEAMLRTQRGQDSRLDREAPESHRRCADPFAEALRRLR